VNSEYANIQLKDGPLIELHPSFGSYGNIISALNQGGQFLKFDSTKEKLTSLQKMIGMN
jgi:hypothetical protein